MSPESGRPSLYFGKKHLLIPTISNVSAEGVLTNSLGKREHPGIQETTKRLREHESNTDALEEERRAIREVYKYWEQQRKMATATTVHESSEKIAAD